MPVKLETVLAEKALDHVPAIVHRPQDVARLTLAAIDDIIAHSERDLVRTYTPLDKELSLRPHTLSVVCALSSNWKTGFMKWMAQNIAEKLDFAGNECIIMVTWEDSVEEYGLSHLAGALRLDTRDILKGKVDQNKLRLHATKMGARPLYLIGHSEETRKSMPVLTMAEVTRAIKALEDNKGLRPAAVFLDYLQMIERDTDIRETRDQYKQNLIDAKKLSQLLECHVMIGAQASEEVSKRTNKIPQMGDMYEVPAAGRHIANNTIGLWRPWSTGDRGAIQVGGHTYQITPDLLFAQIVKQKMGELGVVSALSVDFAQGAIRGAYVPENSI